MPAGFGDCLQRHISQHCAMERWQNTFDGTSFRYQRILQCGDCQRILRWLHAWSSQRLGRDLCSQKLYCALQMNSGYSALPGVCYSCSSLISLFACLARDLIEAYRLKTGIRNQRQATTKPKCSPRYGRIHPVLTSQPSYLKRISQ